MVLTVSPLSVYQDCLLSGRMERYPLRRWNTGFLHLQRNANAPNQSIAASHYKRFSEAAVHETRWRYDTIPYLHTPQHRVVLINSIEVNEHRYQEDFDDGNYYHRLFQLTTHHGEITDCLAQSARPRCTLKRSRMAPI